MEFNGGVYYSRTPTKEYQDFVCRRRDKPLSNGLKSGFNLFYSKTSVKFRKENPKFSLVQLGRLVGNAWTNLPADRKAVYRRQALERQSNERKDRPCSGWLRFRRENGQVMKTADGLIDYVLHSKQFSIETNFSEVSFCLLISFSLFVLIKSCESYTTNSRFDDLRGRKPNENNAANLRTSESEDDQEPDEPGDLNEAEGKFERSLWLFSLKDLKFLAHRPARIVLQ